MSLKIRYKPPKKEKDPSAPMPPKHTDDKKQKKKKERALESCKLPFTNFPLLITIL
jgi:hypothetical protein